MYIPWKTVISVGGTVVVSAVGTLIQQHQQKKLIEDIGTKIGKEVVDTINKQN